MNPVPLLPDNLQRREVLAAQARTYRTIFPNVRRLGGPRFTLIASSPFGSKRISGPRRCRPRSVRDGGPCVNGSGHAPRNAAGASHDHSRSRLPSARSYGYGFGWAQGCPISFQANGRTQSRSQDCRHGNKMGFPVLSRLSSPKAFAANAPLPLPSSPLHDLAGCAPHRHQLNSTKDSAVLF
jgi:hypothetical protein